MLAFNVSKYLWYLRIFYTTADSRITINAASTLSISNIKMKASNVTVSVDLIWRVFDPESPTTITSDSALFISDNSVEVSNVSVGRVWALRILYTSISSHITINANSTLSISSNRLATSGVSAVGDWKFRLMEHGSHTTVTSDSTLLVSHNSMVASNVVAALGFICIVSCATSTANTNSGIIIENNNVVVSNVNVTESCSFYALHSSTPITIDANSTLAINLNGMAVHNVSAGGDWNWRAFESNSATRITSDATLTVTNNSLVATYIEARKANLGVVVWASYTAAMAVKTSSHAIIDNNTVFASNVKATGTCLFYTLYSSSPITIHIGSALVLSGNSIVGANLRSTNSCEINALYTLSLITVNMSSTLTVSHNSIDVSEANVGTHFMCRLFRTISPRITLNSTLIIISSSMAVSEAVVVGYLILNLLYTDTSSAPTDIGYNSTIALSRNKMVIFSANSSSSLNCRVFEYRSPTTITFDSTLTIVDNIVSTRGVVAPNVGVSVLFSSTTASIMTITTHSHTVIDSSTLVLLNISVNAMYWFCALYTVSPVTINAPTDRHRPKPTPPPTPLPPPQDAPLRMLSEAEIMKQILMDLEDFEENERCKKTKSRSHH
jgi:hypothetical protein